MDYAEVCTAGGYKTLAPNGARNPNEAKAVLIAKNRRRLGIEAVRSHAQLKMDRLRAERGGGNERQARQREASATTEMRIAAPTPSTQAALLPILLSWQTLGLRH